MAVHEVSKDELSRFTEKDFAIIELYSDGCAPCKALANYFDILNNELPFIDFVKLNTSEYPEVSKKYDVMATPTILFIKDGEVAEKKVGLMNPDELKEKISAYYY